MTAAGIFNQVVTAGHALTGKAATPKPDSATGAAGSSGANNSSRASGNTATISANDFLTLLVTEMQNQDPTATTDPNEYINQLVEVNSLEQLIGINQTLTTDLGSTTPSSGTGSSAEVAGPPACLTGTNPASGAPRASAHPAGALPAAQSSTAAGIAATTKTAPAQHAPGNLGVPRANPAAQRVAHALDGRIHAQSASGAIFAAQ